MSAAADRAYDFAKQRILDGTFEGGDLISEGEVAGLVGMSRTPVREAFLRLEGEGLLRLYPKRGALVVPVSVGEVENVMETRLVVERHAIVKAITYEADVGEDLRTVIARQEKLAAAGDSRAFVEADREFHRVFVVASGNAILLQLHDSLRDRQDRMGLAALTRDTRRTRQIIDEHRELTELVIARRRDEALAAIDRHLYGTLALLLPGAGAPTPPLHVVPEPQSDQGAGAT